MKKFSFAVLFLLFILLFAGCGTEEKANIEKKGNDAKTTETAKTEPAEKEKTNKAAKPQEPTAEDLCYFCNMKIYTEDEEMGVFTAQAVKEDGTHVYLDDSGCLLNAERKFNENFTSSWVRDYNTKEWIDAESAVVVKADVQTPMKYGYAFFKDKESANKYMSENQTNGVLSSWKDIDTEAEKRYMKKMQMQAEQQKEAGNADAAHNQEMNMNH
ncbi:nitrous oxide reductase accessory protein NosL [Bacillus benzoevorans]|uniref:Nitrous oxide reductase accessory protein NosL n=1 Tax=Bacillus benzoevorans TaxID=1456 RepID=A0A7X0HR13_9BACI|nr:nitrous oxide reductase accessory protein NosL [Bacillus benzoevorans]MBB6445372.1 nitrous oxide reductase accessory protein NosL [Bacillus benzoevorans]